MVILKSKIKSNFKILLLLILTNFIFCQGIFLDKNSETIHSLSGDYSKRNKLKDFNYDFSYSLVFNGKLQLSLSYKKNNNYYVISNVEEEKWEEFTSLSFNYFIKPQKFLHYCIKTEFQNPSYSNSQIETFSKQ